jgi:hypothetical protein
MKTTLLALTLSLVPRANRGSLLRTAEDAPAYR